MQIYIPTCVIKMFCANSPKKKQDLIALAITGRVRVMLIELLAIIHTYIYTFAEIRAKNTRRREYANTYAEYSKNHSHTLRFMKKI